MTQSTNSPVLTLRTVAYLNPKWGKSSAESTEPRAFCGSHASPLASLPARCWWLTPRSTSPRPLQPEQRVCASGAALFQTRSPWWSSARSAGGEGPPLSGFSPSSCWVPGGGEFHSSSTILHPPPHSRKRKEGKQLGVKGCSLHIQKKGVTSWPPAPARRPEPPFL